MQTGSVTVDGYPVGTIEIKLVDQLDETFTPDIEDYIPEDHNAVPPHGGHGAHLRDRVHNATHHGTAAHLRDRVHNVVTHGATGAHLSDRASHRTGPMEGDSGLTGSAYLKSQRQRLGDEIAKDPEVRKALPAIGVLEHESDMTPVYESLANRAIANHMTLRQALGLDDKANSFYGPMRDGRVDRMSGQLEHDPKRRANAEHHMNEVLSGSNILKGATDQGSPTDKNADWPGGRLVRDGEVYNDWGGGVGHEGNRRFREEQQRHVNSESPGAMNAPNDQPPAAFIMHHTGGGSTPQSIRDTLHNRGLGVEYIMDREGNIVPGGGNMRSHMLPGWGKGEGLSNANTVGMEIIAKDNADVNEKQVAAAKAFMAKNYPNTPVYGHGEVNPGHKEADEGKKVVDAIRAEREEAKK